MRNTGEVSVHCIEENFQEPRASVKQRCSSRNRYVASSDALVILLKDILRKARALEHAVSLFGKPRSVTQRDRILDAGYCSNIFQ